MEKTTVNVEDFFSEEYESNGEWFQPIVKGKPCGIEFLVTGMGKDENLVSQRRSSGCRRCLRERERAERCPSCTCRLRYASGLRRH